MSKDESQVLEACAERTFLEKVGFPQNNVRSTGPQKAKEILEKQVQFLSDYSEKAANSGGTQDVIALAKAINETADCLMSNFYKTDLVTGRTIDLTATKMSPEDRARLADAIREVLAEEAAAADDLKY